jgi:hypothetical protein
MLPYMHRNNTEFEVRVFLERHCSDSTLWWGWEIKPGHIEIVEALIMEYVMPKNPVNGAAWMYNMRHPDAKDANIVAVTNAIVRHGHVPEDVLISALSLIY